MALPLPNIPTHELTLPDSKKTIKYRSMLVGEQKILMLAKSSEDKKKMIIGLKGVLNNCSFGHISENVSLIDFEYFFLHLIMVSEGEESDLLITCSECNHKNEVTVDLRSFKVEGLDRDPKISISDTIGIKMKPPTLEIMNLKQTDDDFSNNLNMIIQCVDFVYDGDSVTYLKDETKKNVTAFFDSLTKDNLKGLLEYVDNLPTLKYYIEFPCTECGHDNTTTIEGINHFFS